MDYLQEIQQFHKDVQRLLVEYDRLQESFTFQLKYAARLIGWLHQLDAGEAKEYVHYQSKRPTSLS